MTSAFKHIAIGPLATITVAGILLLLERYAFPFPAPGVLLLATVLYATWVGGLAAGYLSAVIALVCGLTLVSQTGTLVEILLDQQFRLQFMVAITLGLPLVTFAVRTRTYRVLEAERRTRTSVEAASRELQILQAALDNVDYGVMLLDENLRARFINRASRQLWHMPARLASSRPTFTELMENACRSGAFTLTARERETYVERRVALVRAGDETPIDLHLADGHIVRFQCKALPAGGRFLSYTDVTDLVRHAEKLERLATTDEMTGICNRRHFLALAEDAWVGFLEDRDPFALLILDVDLFKSINDRFGHNVGDAVIRCVAAICHAEKRDSDILALIGGEEFVLLLPKTTGEQAMAFAEQLRRRIESEALTVDGEGLRVTASIGVTETDMVSVGIGDLMKRADQALYDAKRDGRNRVKSRFRQDRPAVPRIAAA